MVVDTPKSCKPSILCDIPLVRNDCVDIPLVRGDYGSGVCIPLERGDCVDIPPVRGDSGGCVGIPLSEEAIVGVVALSLFPLV